MEIPKILWLKKHMAANKFARCQFFDLPDYCEYFSPLPTRKYLMDLFYATVTYKATTSPARSNCSLVCKTSYVPPGVKNSNGFDRSFLSQIGLEEFAEDASRIGGTGTGTAGAARIVLTAGLPVGRGLSREAAHDLGLLEGTPVGSGVIDA